LTPMNTKSKEAPTSASLFRTLIIAFSLVAILSCVSIGVLTYYLRAQGIRDQQYRLLETLRDEKMINMSTWFAERAGDVSLVVTRPDIISFCEAHTKDNAVGHQEVLTALASMQKAYRYESVFLADAKGRTVASTEPESYSPGSLPKREANLHKAIREKRNIVSDVLINRVHAKPTMFLFSPVFRPETSELIGVLGILLNPSVWLYPQFARSKYLGETGEILLLNRDGIAQSPLKYHEGAIATMTIRAEPATRGAAGEFGIIAVDDYRPEPVMAAYGHIKEFNWGIVVKQDMSEINAPVRSMARNVLGVSGGVLFFALACGFFIAKRISLPALRIADAAVLIGEGNLDVRAPREGPAEIQRIAVNLNTMAAKLGLQVSVTQGVATIVAIAVKHNNRSDLLEEVLPMLMEATRSQLGVVYLAGGTKNKLDQVLVHGVDAERLAQQITVTPPDHLLTQNLFSESIRVLKDIPEGNELLISTQAGESAPRALLVLPLLQRGTVAGVVGLASLYDYDDTAQQIADLTASSIAQAVTLCGAFEASERMRIELAEGNQELTAANEELRTSSEELQEQAVELEAQRQQVAEADRLKSEFLSNMSHELRTPLNSVLSLSQLMLENGVGAAGGEDKERVEIIERNGRRLLNLINDILDLSKIESGKMELLVSSFPIREPIDAVVAAIRPMADEKGLSVTVEAAEMDDMRSDKDKLLQILLNLLSNAQKFTEKGEISVTVRQAGASAVFSVRDTGCGISKDDLPHIFDEFRQVDGSTTRQHGGTGLGLAICQRLTALLGGEIAVQSEVGKGTTFTVTIPMVIADESTGSGRDATVGMGDVQEWQSGSEPPRILLVEDNEVAIDQVTRALKAAGFVVDVAKNGEEGLAKTREAMPDGVILDLMMPKVDGFQMLEIVRSGPETAHLPVLVLTAKDLTAAERASLSHNNVQQLIQKGRLDRAALVSAVRRLVGMPEAPVTEKQPPAKPAPRVVRKKGGKVTVLVVDDHADNLTTTRSIIGGMNLEIFEAMDGKEAVAMAKSRRPDIILMDIQMPVMGGIEATQRIKQDESLRNTVVIALTASAMMGDREAILAAGCDDYLSKPVEPGKLQAMLEKWIGGEQSHETTAHS
jgi:signal transduction histidine kinase/DNA-binding response OmpR family regulator